MAVLYLLLFVSVFIDSLKNTYYNYFGKNQLDTPKDSFLFNMVCCIGSAILLAFLGMQFKISSYSMVSAIIFAAVTVGAQYFSLQAMKLGSMSFSVLFTYISMLIPTIFGVICYGTPVSVFQYIGLLLMIVCFVLSVDLKKDSQMSVKWFLAALASFLAWGLVGVCQQVHQNSPHADELNGFLMWSFIFSTVMFALLYFIATRKKNSPKSNFKIKSRDSIGALITGAVIGAVNIINLYLSGKMDPVIFFPIVNGGVIVLSGLAAILFFKEKLSVKQTIGLILGIAATCFLSL